MPTLPAFPTIAALHAAFAAGLTVPALLDHLYRRIAAIDDPGIFITLRGEAEVRAEAKMLAPFDPIAFPLWGVPFAVKDNIDAAGLPTTAGCPAFAYTPQASAPAVQRLREAGAILLGKTNLDQFATGLVGLRTPYPAPRNAIDAAYVPGGSSSGSAVAVAHGMVAFALGTDTAGSGRVPAALNNIVGLKPSLGAVSSRGMVPACRTLDTISVFAGTVADAAAVAAVISAYDPADPFSRPSPPGNGGVPPGVPAGLRIGVPDAASRRFAGDALSAAAFDAALADCATELDTTPVPVDMAPLFAVADLLYRGPWVAERYAAIRALIESNPDALHPTTRRVIEGARAYSAADAFDGLYRLAALRRAQEALWRDIDVLLVPSYPRPHRVATVLADPLGPNSELGTYTNFVNLLDLAALAVPGRFRADGFPSGVTLIARRDQDGLLAALGARLHAAAGVGIGTSTLRPVLAPSGVPQPAAAEIPLVVFGAHLSGMALNGELRALGGRFLTATTTTPDYRLYALAGGPPARPGVIRVATGSGVAIAAEVWTLPPEGFARFVAAIPAPLGIGTVRLADGSTAKGFLAEPEGLIGARDISSSGGWRDYIARLSP
jgi:allophanate hydrolase